MSLSPIGMQHVHNEPWIGAREAAISPFPDGLRVLERPLVAVLCKSTSCSSAWKGSNGGTLAAHHLVGDALAATSSSCALAATGRSSTSVSTH